MKLIFFFARKFLVSVFLNETQTKIYRGGRSYNTVSVPKFIYILPVAVWLLPALKGQKLSMQDFIRVTV